MIQQKPIYKWCQNCRGQGKIKYSTTFRKYNPKTGYHQSQKQFGAKICNVCGSTGKVINKEAQEKRKQEKRIAYQKERKYQQFLTKQKKFVQYTQQNGLKKHLLSDIEDQIIYAKPKLKSEAELRAQFQKKYTQQQQQAKRLQEQKKQKQQLRQRQAKRHIQQRQRKLQQDKNKQWQEFIKTPQGIEYLKKRQIQSKQEEIQKEKLRKQQQRIKKFKCFLKILCCGDTWSDGVIWWVIILAFFGAMIYILTPASK